MVLLHQGALNEYRVIIWIFKYGRIKYILYNLRQVLYIDFWWNFYFQNYSNSRKIKNLRYNMFLTRILEARHPTRRSNMIKCLTRRVCLFFDVGSYRHIYCRFLVPTSDIFFGYLIKCLTRINSLSFFRFRLLGTI